MMDPKVVLLMLALAGGYYGYTNVAKPTAIKVAHVTKTGAEKVGHGLQWVGKKAVGR